MADKIAFLDEGEVAEPEICILNDIDNEKQIEEGTKNTITGLMT
eukprot:CAMPEP_0201589636 /NCGR_PEP_ID=MMETSP0190_2-20130828/169039_1 /ASSEMBLY_ACC=CAM_ASM_000263 /TAXON_ID=37353 /ORGANISM="Rosalina sp." /LENGTH=43 /DNA_ID= /DNA_START= /DNA_END= /DNA_ORIENTATION=